LHLGQQQFCVQPCQSHEECVSGLCNPIEESLVGWCEIGDGGESPDGLSPDPQPETLDPGPEADPSPDADPDPSPEAEPDATPPDTAASQPGQRCDCDSDCAEVSGYGGVCIMGICMIRASSGCSSSGSRGECPDGARCWSGTGIDICCPDCGAFGDCAGTCDEDNSCVSGGAFDCYDVCGAVCDMQGNPPDTPDPGPDPEPEMSPDPDPEMTPDPEMGTCGTMMESEEFRLTNQARAESGRPALECDEGLIEVARDHSEDMARRGFFSHTNPDGEQPWDRMRRAGISFRTAGENIAYGYSSAAAVHNGWMNSSGHRANILSGNYTHIGVGLFDDGGTLYWTQVFARY